MKAKLLTLSFLLFTAIALNAQDPTIILQTGKETGTLLKLELRVASPDEVGIDWGNGVVQKYSVETTSTKVEGMLEGNTIKIYNGRINFFNCIKSRVTNIDVSKAAELQQLYCDGNELKVLDVSNNRKLVRLGCPANQLTKLDLSKNQKLTGLYIWNNLFEVDALNQIFTAIPKLKNKPQNINLRIKGNPGTEKSSVNIATNKNWDVDVLKN